LEEFSRKFSGKQSPRKFFRLWEKDLAASHFLLFQKFFQNREFLLVGLSRIQRIFMGFLVSRIELRACIDNPYRSSGLFFTGKKQEHGVT
jgi:hypothetical protein